MSIIDSTQNRGILTASLFMQSNKFASHKTNTLLDIIKANNPEKAEALRKEQEQANQVLQQLKSMKTDMDAERKARAEEEVERLKKLIQSLQMFGGMNPKATARMAARLARELGAAVKEYASASGSVGDVSTNPSATNDLNNVPADTSSPAGVEINAEASGVTKTADAFVTGGVNSKDTSQIQLNEKGKSTFLQNIDAQVVGMAAKGKISEDDQKFKNDVQNLVGQLKSIIEMAKQKMMQEEGGDGTNDQGVKDAGKVFKEIEKALKDIMSAGNDGSFASVANHISSTSLMSTSINILIYVLNIYEEAPNWSLFSANNYEYYAFIFSDCES